MPTQEGFGLWLPTTMGHHLALSIRENTPPVTRICIRSTDIVQGTYLWLTTATSAAAQGIEGGQESDIVLNRCRSLSSFASCIGSGQHPKIKPMNGSSPNKNSSGKISGFAAAAASAAFLS